ncbi:MAG: hypothetical protein IKP77_00485 [Acholeplasmatales bacterium]|nr:hypothetical protein [Acholeplasmatales bacterium]
MVKIDLICGFLGAGKTTFLIKYANYLIERGERICILENDYGAINVDMMLISNLDCDREMVSGGCDYDCHLRRFRTKLISMAMRGYTRVIVEPSGIYDTDEFFDVLYEEPLSNMYEIGNIFCIYDYNTKDLSYESRYILASEASVAGKIIVSKRNDGKLLNLEYLNDIMAEFKSIKIFNDNDIVYEDDMDLNKLINVGYHSYDHIKIPINNDNNYESIYYLDSNITLEDINSKKEYLFNDNIYGNVVRIKGFIFENNKWNKVNITKNEIEVDTVLEGQKVIIIIGENLNRNKISELLGDVGGL